jgi:rSAM/selenodomain-associated transferase 2
LEKVRENAFVVDEPSISVIIPALNAEGPLPGSIAALRRGMSGLHLREIIVVDGGSQDDTREKALAQGARVVACDPGRGQQLRHGATQAGGDWLLFLHADTRLSPDWGNAAARFMAESMKMGEPRAAVFRLKLDDTDERARRVERLARWRARALGLPYGDQGLLIGRAFYGELGGYRPMALMEDVEFVRRIGKSRLVELPCDAVTSAARYRRDGWYRRPVRNLLVLALYLLGLPQGVLRRVYG